MHTLRTVVIAAAVFTAAFALRNHRTGDDLTPHRARSGAMEALEFWSEARTYPTGKMPPDRYHRAFEWASRAAVEKGADLPFAAGGWSYIGPSNLSGRMLAVALNPQNPSTIWAGSASGGLWRSFTGGVAGDWHRIVTGHPVLGVAAVAIHPTDSNTVYIGTGEVYRRTGTAGGLIIRTTRGSYGMGLLKTTDGGATWTKSLDWSYNQERGVQMIRINPLNPSSVWAATTEGIYRSTDAGASWTVMLPIEMGQDIVIHPTDTLRMLASTGNLGLSTYVLRSTDGGVNWTPVTPIDFTGKTLLASWAGNPDLVFASVADSTTGVGSLWASTDFGAGWTQRSNNTTNNIFGVQGWYSHFVAVHPLDSSIVFHAGVPASRSVNGGVTFSGVAGTYSDHHAYAWNHADPNILYVANDDGIYRSTNAGTSFTKVSQNLATGQFYNGFSASATDSLIALGQVQDHIPGYLYQGSAFWPLSAVDEVGWTAIDQINDSIMYAGTRNGGSIRRSTNRGASFLSAGGGFFGLSCWNAPFVLSPSSPNILYFGRSVIFKSTNNASSWVAQNGGIALDGNPALSMGICATNPDVVYVGTGPRVTRSHVFTTTNGGVSWTDVTGALPDRHPLDIAVHPTDPLTAYVGFGGYGTGHVFRTTDGGASWTDVTGSLPDIPVTALLVDPASPQVVYLGSDIGVYASTNSGGTWIPMNEGLPEAVLVSDLTLTPSNRTLRASTHGNSVFARKMPAAFPAVTGVVPSGGETWEVGSQQTIRWSQTLLSSVRIDYSTDGGSTWNPVAASVPAWPDSFTWTVPPTLTSQARVRVSSAADTLVTAQSAGDFSITFDGVIYDLAADWNLLSLPLVVPDPGRNALFPGAVGKVYAFAGAYTSAETLETGRGYWLKHGAPALIPIGGDSLLTDTIPLSGGWNLVGSLMVPVAAASLSTEPGGLLSTPFFGYDGGYAEADTLVPGRGYWVKSSGPGVLLAGTAAAASGSARRELRDARTGALRFTDARGRTASFTVSHDPADRRFDAELPPPPPAGGFDLRSDGGGSHLVADGGSAAAILAGGVRFPVTVSWSLPAGQRYRLDPGSGEPVLLTGSGSAAIGWAAGFSLHDARESSGAPPAEFALLPNYPNPFNPETRIGFTVPPGPDRSGSGARVSLRVYDVVGRLIAVLADGPFDPGAHEAVWSAAGAPAGVYVSVLQAGGRSFSRKMLLVK